MSDNNDSKEFFWACAAIALLTVLFNGDPDLADALRMLVLSKVGVAP